MKCFCGRRLRKEIHDISLFDGEIILYDVNMLICKCGDELILWDEIEKQQSAMKELITKRISD